MLLDCHCHLHDREFFKEEDAEKYLKKAKEQGIGKIICIGTSVEDSLVAKSFAEAHKDVFWTYGIHPEHTDNLSNILPKNRDIFSDPKLVAIGEIGLDYHYSKDTRDVQIRLFEEMIQFAIDLNLPISFHIREAFDDFFPIISNFPKLTGVVHSFSDSKKTLRKILDSTDFYIGVNGLATYSTLPMPPLDRIILETDAPFLTPEPFRGKINQPAYIKNIAEWLSTKLGVSFAEVEAKTTQNGTKLFRFPDPVSAATGSSFC